MMQHQAMSEALDEANQIARRTIGGEVPRRLVKTFFDEATFTATHAVHDPETLVAVIIDSVMEFKKTILYQRLTSRVSEIRTCDMGLHRGGEKRHRDPHSTIRVTPAFHPFATI